MPKFTVDDIVFTVESRVVTIEGANDVTAVFRADPNDAMRGFYKVELQQSEDTIDIVVSGDESSSLYQQSPTLEIQTSPQECRVSARDGYGSFTQDVTLLSKGSAQ